MDTLYVFITGMPDWPRGTRQDFVLNSVRATDQTRIEVLGHGGKFSEYQPTIDITPRYRQTEQGLAISVCRAQRLYNNHKWHNPIVVKLSHVQPALAIPPYAETGEAVTPKRGPDSDGFLGSFSNIGKKRAFCYTETISVFVVSMKTVVVKAIECS